MKSQILSYQQAKTFYDRFGKKQDWQSFCEDVAVLKEAWRILSEGGLLGLTSSTHGIASISRLAERSWVTIHSIRPMLVGGCRPINLLELVNAPYWKVRYEKEFSNYGVATGVLVAEKAIIP
jgi:hypothetical protein